MHQVKLTSFHNDINASKMKHTSQDNILWTPEVPSEHPKTVALEHDHLCTLVPSIGIGSYASQPRETHRLTLAMLMEIMIQPQSHTKQHPCLTLMPDRTED